MTRMAAITIASRGQRWGGVFKILIRAYSKVPTKPMSLCTLIPSCAKSMDRWLEEERITRDKDKILFYNLKLLVKTVLFFCFFF